MSRLSNIASRAGLAAATLILAAPAFAADTAVTPVAPEHLLTLGGVVTHAKPLIMLMFAGLAAAIAYAAFVYIRGVIAPKTERPSGLAFLWALAAGGPLIGLFGASYGLLDMSIGIANTRPEATLTMLAPGYAEAALCVCLGLLAGAIAVIGHRHLTGRLEAAMSAQSAAPSATPAHLARSAI
jgi:hypothetical protein